MYNVLFTERARREIKKLPGPIQIRINSVLERLIIRPFVYVKKLIGVPYYRLRVGDYRVILEIRKNKLIILVITLGHRKKIYKRVIGV